MRISLFLLLVLTAACRAPAPSIADNPDVGPGSPPVPAVAVPVPATEAQLPAAVTSAEASVVEPLLVALAKDDTTTLVSHLADDVSVTLANDDACTGRAACAVALGKALEGVKVQVIRHLHVSARTDVIIGLALVASRRVPVAAVLVSAGGKIQTVRVYGDTTAWRYILPPPKTPPAPLAHEPVDSVASPSTADGAALAAAFDPQALAKDALGHGRVAPALIYHDLARATETHGALENQAAIRAFLAAFDVKESQLLAHHAAGDWLVLEREVTVVQRAPVVPVPPTEDLLRLRTLEVLLLAEGKISEVWGYSDPVALVPAVEQLPIPPIH